MAGDPDPKRGPRVVDPKLLKELHERWPRCAIADDTCVARRSLHHIYNKPRDDVEANLVMLCGDGTTGHHGLVQHQDYASCRRLAVHLIKRRLDTMAYLGEQLGGVVAVAEWLRRRLYAPV